MTVGLAMLGLAVILVGGAGWLLRSLGRDIPRGHPHSLELAIGRRGVVLRRTVEPHDAAPDEADEADQGEDPVDAE